MNYSTDPGPRSSSPVAMDTNDVGSRPTAYCKCQFELSCVRLHTFTGCNQYIRFLFSVMGRLDKYLICGCSVLL